MQTLLKTRWEICEENQETAAEAANIDSGGYEQTFSHPSSGTLNNLLRADVIHIKLYKSESIAMS